MTLGYSRRGAGHPLVLLHALGTARDVWNPVMDTLAERFDVLAVDLPGFGDSAPMPAAVEPVPSALAAAVAVLLDELDVTRPHIAGNSLGGWVALELARIRPAASVALLSPAGLWHGNTPLYCRVSLRVTRWLAEHGATLLSHVVASRLGRILVLGQTHGRPARLSADYARSAIRTMGTCPGFNATLAATATRHYQAGAIDAPVTIAFGSRDVLLLPRQSRHLDQLPPDTHTGELPGCGHIPIADNPAAVIDLITASAARSSPADRASDRSLDRR